MTIVIENSRRSDEYLRAALAVRVDRGMYAGRTLGQILETPSGG